MKSFKEKYEEAKANGLEELARDDEISRRISLIVSPSAQQALQTNMIDDLINGRPFGHKEEWEHYQAVRHSIIAKVDDEIESFKGVS